MISTNKEKRALIERLVQEEKLSLDDCLLLLEEPNDNYQVNVPVYNFSNFEKKKEEKNETLTSELKFSDVLQKIRENADKGLYDFGRWNNTEKAKEETKPELKKWEVTRISQWQVMVEANSELHASQIAQEIFEKTKPELHNQYSAREFNKRG